MKTSVCKVGMGKEFHIKSLLLKLFCSPSYSLLNADKHKLSPENLSNAENFAGVK